MIANADKAAGASEVSSFLPDIAVNRRADDPLTNLRSFLLQTDRRVMICAETLGRRETLQQYFNEYAISLSLCEGYTDFVTSNAKLMLGVAPLHAGFILADGIAFVTEAELYAGSGKRIGRKNKKQSRKSNTWCATCRNSKLATLSCIVTMVSAAIWA